MSHWTTVKTNIKNLAYLGEACNELKLKLDVAQDGKTVTAIGYGNNRMEVPARITSTTKSHRWHYDIAIQKEKDGTYAMTTDWYDGKEQIVGKDFKKLNQLYAVHATLSAVKAKGWSAQRRVLKNGSIQIQVSGV